MATLIYHRSIESVAHRIAAKRFTTSAAIAEWLGHRRTTICEKVAALYPKERTKEVQASDETARSR